MTPRKRDAAWQAVQRQAVQAVDLLNEAAALLEQARQDAAPLPRGAQGIPARRVGEFRAKTDMAIVQTISALVIINQLRLDTPDAPDPEALELHGQPGPIELDGTAELDEGPDEDPIDPYDRWKDEQHEGQPEPFYIGGDDE